MNGLRDQQRKNRAPGPGEEPIRASASRGRPAPQPEPEEALGLSQLPPELLLAVLSLLPPRTLLGRCRQVCRRWRALVDAPGLWLKILARDHRALWCHKKETLDLEAEGLWPELLDSGKVEIRVSHCPPGVAGAHYKTTHVDAANRYQTTLAGHPVSHVFSNLKTGVRFVSLKHWIWDFAFWPEQCGIYLPNSSVIVQGQAGRGSPVVPEPKEALGLSQLPPELLLAVLSLLPPRTLLGRCRQVCRRWRALVDAPGLWLKILARDHRALWPVVRSCLPRADAASACLLGRFCARGPIGRNLLCKPESEDGFQKWMRLSDGDDWPEEENCQVIPGLPYLTYLLSAHRCCYNKKVLDLEEEGFWPELLDSGKMEIYVSHRWTDQQGTNCVYQLIAQILDANHVILDHFSPKPYPIRQCRNNVSHVFSNLKTGVRFVSLEHWIWDMELYSEHCGIYLPDSSVIVQVILS
ncbi:F-box only protein 27 [Camelus dromedarius]|uniref:F-box only protein 27 n=1 Tax=Camelus dromedarius TaxID=9838 RepID=A0A5N4DQH9_CAMDR|nr:F-box only protein 27 [Camelus dromedarius]